MVFPCGPGKTIHGGRSPPAERSLSRRSKRRSSTSLPGAVVHPQHLPQESEESFVFLIDRRRHRGRAALAGLRQRAEMVGALAPVVVLRFITTKPPTGAKAFLLKDPCRGAQSAALPRHSLAQWPILKIFRRRLKNLRVPDRPSAPPWKSGPCRAASTSGNGWGFSPCGRPPFYNDETTHRG